MTTTKIPQYGDPELLPKGTVRADAGAPSVYSEQEFYLAPDIKGLPWTRHRGDEWTVQEFRAVVFAWLLAFIDERGWVKAWHVKEVATGVRSGRLPPPQHHLVFTLTPHTGEPIEVGIAFPEKSRTSERANAILSGLGTNFDDLFAKQS